MILHFTRFFVLFVFFHFVFKRVATMSVERFEGLGDGTAAGAAGE